MIAEEMFTAFPVKT